jgi:PIN domain nuclease of toxin-antitoxin system
LNPEDEVIINKDENIFTSVVNRYTVARLVKEERLSDKEEIKKVDTAKALKAMKTVKIWKLHKRNSQDL